MERGRRRGKIGREQRTVSGEERLEESVEGLWVHGRGRRTIEALCCWNEGRGPSIREG